MLHWNFDPTLLQLGPLAVRWYGLLFVGAFWVGQALLARMFVRDGQPAALAERLLLWALVGTIVGARLVHVVFYDPAYYGAHPLAVLRVWEGGLASHGGALGLLAGLWWGLRGAAQPLTYLGLLDRVAVPAALGAVFVRVANFLNSEIVGRPTGGGWGVIFERVDAVPRHPVQLYEAAAYAAIFVLLFVLWQRGAARRPGLLFGSFLATVFAARVVAEFFKTPQAAYEAGQAFTVGQWLSLPFVAVGLWFIWRSRSRG